MCNFSRAGPELDSCYPFLGLYFRPIMNLKKSFVEELEEILKKGQQIQFVVCVIFSDDSVRTNKVHKRSDEDQ